MFMKVKLILVLFLLCHMIGPGHAEEEKTMDPEKAIFAGGCFWCIESVFKELPGVVGAVSGYTGGDEQDPAYSEVSSGATGHLEAVEVTYDPAQIFYEELLNVFWRQIDPTDAGGQFADRGSQYQTAICYFTEEQEKIAEESKANLDKSGMFGKPAVTEIRMASRFYPAEEYHQDYSKKQPGHYKMYRIGSGREGFIKETWDKKPLVCPLPKRLEKSP